jgi:deazaflavin-dependent oxidoreductase (nitroreductase family)
MTVDAEIDRLPPAVPRWIVKTIWTLHRTAYSVTGGRFGLREPGPGRWGMLRLTTTGRRSGLRRAAILGYLEDGPNLVVPAMNGWAEADPAWWLNLQANPEATVELPTGPRQVVARAAEPMERDRLWALFVAVGSSAYTHASERQRGRPTAIAILEPAPDQ